MPEINVVGTHQALVICGQLHDLGGSREESLPYLQQHDLLDTEFSIPQGSPALTKVQERALLPSPSFTPKRAIFPVSLRWATS